MNQWERCPVCVGSGYSVGSSIQQSTICTVCEGNKIINSSTGLPRFKKQDYQPMVYFHNLPKNGEDLDSFSITRKKDIESTNT